MMDAALLSGFIKAVLPKLFSVVCDEYKLHSGVKRNINFLLKELHMIVASLNDDDELSIQAKHNRSVPPLLMEDLRDLAYGIEDCIDRVLYKAIMKQQSSLVRRGTRFPKTLFTDRWLAAELQRLRDLVQEAHERKKNYGTPGQQPSSVAAQHMDDESSCCPVSDPSTIDADLVGVNGPMAHLMDQLAEVEGGGAKQQKVIAIVGFSGMGKTALAAKVYNSQVARGSFLKHAWVPAGDRRPAEVLTQLLRKISARDVSSWRISAFPWEQVGAGSSQGASESDILSVVQKKCAHRLANKRYLVVIDDIRTEELWTKIKSAFPADDGISSRIVITTTNQRVANDCTSTKGYVHKMSRLDDECSRKLFSMNACPKELLCYKQPDSEAILKKCHGQPLALVTVAKFMRTNGWPIDPSCEHLCSRLHYYLENDTTFQAMRRLLIRNYTNLRGHVLKSCLLYFAMFPSDYQIRRESLFRRWLAEGFVEFHSNNGSTPDPTTVFRVLMERNIIETTYSSNNERVKTCQTYGLMHEFILHMSINQNFATLLCDEMTEQKYIRRLSLHKNTAMDGKDLDPEVLSFVRSLSIFGKASDTILDFSKYRLLRVLDLEKCDNLENDHLNDICSLLLLKYLSLGKNISILPKEIVNLRVLESLDLRGTDVKILPQKVLRMPGLIHLFGKFKLPDKLKPKSHDFLRKGKSKLQTLAGFIADGRQDYLTIMGCMEKLNIVKIWCEPLEDAGTTNWTNLQKAIEQFIEDKKEAKTGARSLSLHFGECFADTIYSLEGPCYLSSLKLHGKLHALPQFVASLRGLEDLCLKSAKLEQDLLEALTELGSLKYLKLVAKDLDKFVIKDGAFPFLLRLCFVLERPTFPTIQKGSMPLLVTLQLLCEDLDGLCGIEMENLRNLKEVILDHGVIADIRRKWEEAAKKHPNKPRVYPIVTSLSGTAVNEESGTTDHGVNLELSKTESPENLAVLEESICGTSIKHDISCFDHFSRIWCCLGFFAVPFPHIRGRCFMVLIMCTLLFLLLISCRMPSSSNS